MLYSIIWTILFSIQAVLIVFSILLYVLYVSWSNDGIHSKNETTAMQVFATFGFFISFFFFCFLLAMGKRIQLAIDIIKEACKAMASMPILILMPVAQVFGVALFLIPWFIYMIYLASSGDMVTHPVDLFLTHPIDLLITRCLLTVDAYVTQQPYLQVTMTATNAIGQPYSYRQFVYTKNTQYTFIFMLFCWFWTVGTHTPPILPMTHPLNTPSTHEHIISFLMFSYHTLIN